MVSTDVLGPVPGVVSADPGAVCGERLPVPGVVSADPGAVCGESLPVPGVVSADPSAVCGESLPVLAVVSADPGVVCGGSWAVCLVSSVAHSAVWTCSLPGVVSGQPARVSGVVTCAACVSDSKLF